MALPDVSRLATLSSEQWRAFAQRLIEIGLTNDAVLALTQVVDDVPHPVRAPLRQWHLRRARTRAADALRLLTYGDELTEAEAADALTGPLLHALVDAGVLSLEAARCRSRFLLTFHGDLYVLVDDVLLHGGDAVMGSGRTTVHLSRASIPRVRAGRVLDFGCGAAPNALALAAHADRVVATDINPRAIVLAGVNAAINGIDNVELRVGDMFAPVAGERFDLVMSQPPFVARPTGRDTATFLFGGARGDEFALRLLAELPQILAPNGVAILYVEWPELPGDPIESRIRAAQPDAGVDVLVLRAPPVPLDVHAAAYAYVEHARLDEAFDRTVVERREHLERMGFLAVSSTLTILRRAPAGRDAWTHRIDVAAFEATTPNRARIDRFMTTRDLLSTNDDARLLAARARLPKRTTIVEERSEPDPNTEPTFVLRFSERALLPPIGINREAFVLLSIVDAAPDVASAAELIAREFQVSIDAARAKLLPHVREALDLGALEVV